MKKFLSIILIILSAQLIGQNVNLSNGLIFDGEPYIAINPNNSNQIVVAWMGYEIGNRIQINTKSSNKGGLSWNTAVNIPHIVAGYTSADVSLAYDLNGTVYLSFIDFTGQNANPVEGAVYITNIY